MSDQPENKNPLKDRRRWWVALLMLFPTGLGYIYVGRPRRFVGFSVFAMLCIAVLYHGLWGWMNEPKVFLAFIAFIFVAVTGFAIDILIIARKQNTHDLRWPQRRKWYLACLALWAVIVFAPGAIGARSMFAVRLFTTSSGSNAPTLKVGDFFIADTTLYDSVDPRRGDVVIFRLPRKTSVIFVKRVIGLPGDKVQMIDSAVVINGVAVPRQAIKDYRNRKGKKIKRFLEMLPNGTAFQTLDTAQNRPLDDTQVYQVPPGHYFVLGDNRDNSSDSRSLDQIGYVPRKNILAKATGVVYAAEWRRIGLNLN